MGVVVPFPVIGETQPEINPLQALRNLEFNMEDVYPVPIVHIAPEALYIMPEHTMPEKKPIDFDFHITGRTELDLTGLKFVQENLERKQAIKRAVDYSCLKNTAKLLHNIKLNIDTIINEVYINHKNTQRN